MPIPPYFGYGLGPDSIGSANSDPDAEYELRSRRANPTWPQNQGKHEEMYVSEVLHVLFLKMEEVSEETFSILEE